MKAVDRTELAYRISQLKARQAAVLREQLRRAAQGNLLAFTRYTKPDYQINWHHRILAEYLEKFARGEIKRLMVFMPPRNGKSEMVSRRLPAYILGRNPDAKVIACSYSADLASMMNRDTQRIIDTPEYRDIFPETTLSGKNIRSSATGSYMRNSDLFEIVGHRGAYRSAGVGGGITGMGADFAIIDDPLKDQAQADSPTIRQNQWDWYTSTLYTRLEKAGSVLLTVTRWHEDDLAGKLLKMAKSDPNADQWVVINFPAIAEEVSNKADLKRMGYQLHLDQRQPGEALWPWKYPAETLKRIEASIGARVWNSLYQQRPSAEEGNVVQSGWWKFYTERPTEFDRQVQSWDMTFKDTDSSDYVVGQVWGKIKTHKYLLDQVRARMGFTATVDKVLELTKAWPEAYEKFIEDKANGPAVMSALEMRVEGMIAIEPNGSKMARASAVSPQMRAGEVFLPDPSGAPWVLDFLEEWKNFPNGAHDDQVDASSQALHELREPLSFLEMMAKR